MESFEWKRKAEKRAALNIFVDEESNEETGDNDDLQEIESLNPTKIPKTSIEADDVKSKRLIEEGEKIAQLGRYWEAIAKWKEASVLTPQESSIYEMTAQALLELGEVFPAVQAAEKAVHLDKNWWIAYQTLGRTQLGIGEIKMAIISFSKALHLNPSNEHLRKDDLQWAVSLINSSQLQSVKGPKDTYLITAEDLKYFLEKSNARKKLSEQLNSGQSVSGS